MSPDAKKIDLEPLVGAALDQAVRDARATADAALVVAQVAAGMAVPGVTAAPWTPWAPPVASPSR